MKRHSFAPAPVLALLALALSALLALAACEFGSPIRSGGGTEGVGLSGTLLRPDGSAAVGARVYAYASNDYGAASPRRSASASEPVALDSAVTDARGFFDLVHLAPGTYNLSASLKNGDDTLGWFLQGVAYPGGRKGLGGDTLRAMGTAAMQVFVGQSLLTGATCRIAGSPYHALTDEQGNCLLELPPGEYRMVVSYPGYGTGTSGVTIVSAGQNSNCGAVDISTAD